MYNFVVVPSKGNSPSIFILTFYSLRDLFSLIS